MAENNGKMVKGALGTTGEVEDVEKSGEERGGERKSRSTAKTGRGDPPLTSPPTPPSINRRLHNQQKARLLFHQNHKMGIPYSKEINSALDQVAPLVAAGFVVLRTTKNISILLMILQILTVLLLGLLLLAAFGIILSVNPDLVAERKALVTPVMKWIAAWIVSKEE